MTIVLRYESFSLIYGNRNPGGVQPDAQISFTLRLMNK